MAWWTTHFVFQNDTLIAEGFDPVFIHEMEPVVQDDITGDDIECYTRVIVSGYALYGKLHGFYALGVAKWFLDRPNGRVLMTERSQRDSEPVSSLTPTQRVILQECLVRLSPEAWETSNILFRRQLEN
jgi:hypothetical protein